MPSEEPPKTVNDWVIHRLGRPVKGGEVLSADGIRAVVRKVRRQRVLEAQIAGPTIEDSRGFMAFPSNDE